ncbi:hypothetical protein D3C76_1621100 [compost metagenome]
MVRYIQGTHGTEENSVEAFQLLQPTLRDVMAILQVALRAPIEVFEGDFEPTFS